MTFIKNKLGLPPCRSERRATAGRVCVSGCGENVGVCVRGKMDRGNNRSEPRARRGRPALARSPAAQQMPPSGSHGSEVAWIPPGPRLYDTAYVLFVCMYPPCPPGAFLLAMRASGMLPVDGSNRSPPVPGPQYLRRPVRQALAQSGTTLAARAAARAAAATTAATTAAMPAAMTASMTAPRRARAHAQHQRERRRRAHAHAKHTQRHSLAVAPRAVLPPIGQQVPRPGP